MHLIALFIFSVISNVIAFITAHYFLPGFIIPTAFEELIIAGVIFAVINMLIRPLVKLFLSPIILLTLGLGIILVNALMLKLLDFLDKSITIQDTLTLIYATLIISAVNLIIHLAAKLLFNKGGSESKI